MTPPNDSRWEERGYTITNEDVFEQKSFLHRKPKVTEIENTNRNKSHSSRVCRVPVSVSLSVSVSVRSIDEDKELEFPVLSGTRLVRARVTLRRQ